MQFITTFIVLALVGLTDASYLAYKHTRKQVLVCPIGSDCEAVVESKWGSTLGIRNEFLGIVFYLGMFCLGVGLVFFPQHTSLLNILARLGTVAGLGFSIFLTFIQVRVLRQYCMYCLISAGITALLFLNAFALPLT